MRLPRLTIGQGMVLVAIYGLALAPRSVGGRIDAVAVFLTMLAALLWRRYWPAKGDGA